MKNTIHQKTGENQERIGYRAAFAIIIGEGRKMARTLIKGAIIADGTGKKPYKGSVLIDGMRITGIITGEKLPVPSLEERISILKTHLDEEIKLRGENVGIKFCRKFYPYYISGIKNAAKIRSILVREENYNKIIETLDLLFAGSCN